MRRTSPSSILRMRNRPCGARSRSRRKVSPGCSAAICGGSESAAPAQQPVILQPAVGCCAGKSRLQRQAQRHVALAQGLALKPARARGCRRMIASGSANRITASLANSESSPRVSSNSAASSGSATTSISAGADPALEPGAELKAAWSLTHIDGESLEQGRKHCARGERIGDHMTGEDPVNPLDIEILEPRLSSTVAIRSLSATVPSRPLSQ
jgi:hypothetical protein